MLLNNTETTSEVHQRPTNYRITFPITSFGNRLTGKESLDTSSSYISTAISMSVSKLSGSNIEETDNTVNVKSSTHFHFTPYHI